MDDNPYPVFTLEQLEQDEEAVAPRLRRGGGVGLMMCDTSFSALEARMVAAWAQQERRSARVVLIDTETTGLNPTDRTLQPPELKLEDFLLPTLPMNKAPEARKFTRRLEQRLANKRRKGIR